MHRVITYQDIQYTNCHKCHTHKATDRKYNLVEIEKEDRTKDEFDFKRNNKRKYKPRNKENNPKKP